MDWKSQMRTAWRDGVFVGLAVACAVSLAFGWLMDSPLLLQGVGA